MPSIPPKSKRPAGVTVISAIAFSGGLLSLFGGSQVLSGMASGPFSLALVVIIFGILGVVLGAGLYKGMGRAWMAGIIIYVISIGLGVAEIVYGGMVGGIGGVIRIVAGVIIPAYLTRRSVRLFFGSAAEWASMGHSQILTILSRPENGLTTVR